MKPWTVVQGDCAKRIADLDDASVDAIVCDPPAGIEFMGKAWDTFRAATGTASGAQSEAWGGFDNPFARQATPRFTGKRGTRDVGARENFIASLTAIFTECLRVLKPGGHALVWALPRTSHWTATAVEDAGFEIRDVVVHLNGQGFPKSLDVSKAIDKAAGAAREVTGPNRWDGINGSANVATFGTASRAPSTAPATDAARQWAGWGTALKPAAEHWILARKPLDGTVAANVLAYGTGGLNIDACRIGTEARPNIVPLGKSGSVYGAGLEGGTTLGRTTLGRWPANVTLDEDAAAMLNEMSGPCKTAPTTTRGNNRHVGFKMDRQVVKAHGGDGGTSRFFYVAKASRAEKTHGGTVDNKHPTVKSIALMRWLVRLITPPGGLVLDPFMGSGSTGVAALAEGCRFLGIEREAEYVKIARARLRQAKP